MLYNSDKLDQNSTRVRKGNTFEKAVI